MPMRLLIYQAVNCMFFIFTDQSLKTLVMMICAGNKSNFFCSLFGKAEETMWQNYTQTYHNCSKKHRGLFSCNLFSFLVIVRVVKSTFSMLLLKTLLAYPRIFQPSSDFGLKFLAYKDPQCTKCQSFLLFTVRNHN